MFTLINTLAVIGGGLIAIWLISEIVKEMSASALAISITVIIALILVFGVN